MCRAQSCHALIAILGQNATKISNMNFDGTYPGTEKYEKGKLLEVKSTEPQQRQPVRVVVSYPQSEEWDGKSKNFCNYCRIFMSKCILVAAITALIAGLAVTAFFYYSNNKEPLSEDPFVFSELERPDDEALRRYLLKDITKHYQRKRQSADKNAQVQYFKKEKGRLEKNKIDDFLSDFRSPIVLPEDPGMKLDIADFIKEYLDKTIAWLEQFIAEEKILTSYDFQTNRKAGSILLSTDPLKNLTAAERSSLQELRELYTCPPRVQEDNGTVTVDGKALVFSEAISIIKSLAPREVKTVVLTSEKIYVDSNFTKNVDLGIFSPEWKVWDNILLDLSGENSTDPDVDVKDGGMGNQGKNGGFFLGVGMSIDRNKLIVVSNGGDAGRGHDGADGRNGTNNLRMDDTITWRCLVPNGLSHGNPAGEVTDLFTTFPDDACGEEGGTGGLAGMPGIGGATVLITSRNQTYQAGNNGSKAEVGKKGKNGTSATSGCYFTAYRITTLMWSKKWNRISTPVCNSTISPPVLPRQPKNTTELRYRQDSSSNRNIILQHFGKRARTELTENNNEKLFELLKILERSQLIAALDDMSTPTLLFQEFVSIYFEHKNPEIFKSFLNKVKAALDHAKNEDSVTALQYLQVAVYSKITQLTTTFGEYYIVDIEKYIEKVLEMVKNLDKEVFKPKTHKPGSEIQQKLREFKQNLLFHDKMACEPDRLNQTDGRIICFVSKIATTLPSMVEVADLTLQDKVPNYAYKAMNETIEEYIELRQTYYLKAFGHVALLSHGQHLLSDLPHFIEKALLWNRTVAEPVLACAEMMRMTEDCTEYGEKLSKWELFFEMDMEIIAAYKRMNKSDPLDWVEKTLDTILMYARESRTYSSKGKEHLMDLRSSILELTQLVRKCQQILKETQLENKVAELNGLRVPKDKKLAKTVLRTKDMIVLNMLWYHYKKTYYAFQQWAFPYTDAISVVRPNATKDELILEIRSIKDRLYTSKSILQENDAHIILADFLLTSATGPFYTWRNADFKALVVELLRGNRVQIRANLEESPHVPLKQAVKFQTAEIALSGVPKSILVNFAVDLIHSGFSHYLYNSTLYTAVGPEVELFHSFDVTKKGDKPTVINQAYNKIKNGDITLSPFTTWSVQIKTVNHRAKFQDLLKYSNVTNVHLVGTGWYTSIH